MFWRDNLPVGIEHVCSFIVKCTSCFYLGFMIDTCFNIFYPIQQQVFRHTLIVLYMYDLGLIFWPSQTDRQAVEKKPYSTQSPNGTYTFGVLIKIHE